MGVSKRLVELLHDIGLNRSEARAYLILLELGLSTTGPLMNKAKISSSKIYGVLSRLIEKGLVSVIVKQKIKHYQASPPEIILEYVEEQEEKLKRSSKDLKTLLPNFNTFQSQKEQHYEAQLFTGWKGIMAGYLTLIEHADKGDEYLCFAQTSVEEASPAVKLFFTQYHRKRKDKKLQVKLLAKPQDKHIFTAKPYANFSSFQVRYTKFIPPGMIILKNLIFITQFGKNPSGTLIFSPDIAQSYKDYFYEMWEHART